MAGACLADKSPEQRTASDCGHPLWSRKRGEKLFLKVHAAGSAAACRFAGAQAGATQCRRRHRVLAEIAGRVLLHADGLSLR